MEELAGALAPLAPDPALRLSIVHQCFSGPAEDAPLSLAIQALTGAVLQQPAAAEAWRDALETQRRWSERIGEVISLKSAAIEALERARRPRDSGPPADGSIRDYLNRDLPTGLHDRETYDAELPRQLLRASDASPFCLMLLDLSGLAELEETAGSRAAEDAAFALGQVLREASRPEDTACRFGAAYAAILVESTGVSEGEQLAAGLLSRLRQALSGLPLRGQIGAAVTPDPETAPLTLESAAAEALLEARGQGGWAAAVRVVDSGRHGSRWRRRW